MRRSHVFLAAAALASLLLVPAASGNKGGTDRPFQATLTGAVTYVVPEGCPPNCVAFTSVTDSMGQATHLGLVKAHWTHRPYDFANHLDGSVTITAANGDALYGVYDYDLFSASPTIAVTITGGTGRFTDASGEVFAIAEAIPQFKPMPPCDPATDPFGCLNPDVPWPWSGTISGTISY